MTPTHDNRQNLSVPSATVSGMPAHTRPPRPLRFGRVLTWTRYPDIQVTQYLGREHQIEKVGRERAQAIGGGCHPGWHFEVHPDAWDIDPAERNPIGPGVGGNVQHARMMAEVWILTSESERRGTDGSPDLVNVMGRGGAGFRARSGRTLIAWPDHKLGQVQICHDTAWNNPEKGALVGTVEVSITADRAADEDGAVSFAWTSELADGTALGTFATWHDACRAVGGTA